MIGFRRLTKLSIPCLAGILFLLTFAAPRASADTISYLLNVPNTAISGYPGPYATVTVDLTDSTHATITFTVYPGVSNSQFMLAGENAAALNINGSATVEMPPTYTQLALFDSPLPMEYGSGTVDGFNVFNFTLKGSDGYTSGMTSITFELTATGGTWGSAASVLKPNDDGYVAAAHIFVCESTPCALGEDALATGFAANGTPIPEPASIALFGSGLIALAGLVRRRRKQNGTSN